MNLLCFISSGIWFSILSALVPTLLEYINIKICSKLTCFTTSIVSSKSSSVSPGKPTIISVENTTSGILFFILFIKSKYCSFVYFLFISFNTFVLPDWSGTCINLDIFLLLLITSITSSVKSFGCGETNLITSIPSILSTSSNSGSTSGSGRVSSYFWMRVPIVCASENVSNVFCFGFKFPVSSQSWYDLSISFVDKPFFKALRFISFKIDKFSNVNSCAFWLHSYLETQSWYSFSKNMSSSLE